MPHLDSLYFIPSFLCTAIQSEGHSVYILPQIIEIIMRHRAEHPYPIGPIPLHHSGGNTHHSDHGDRDHEQHENPKHHELPPPNDHPKPYRIRCGVSIHGPAPTVDRSRNSEEETIGVSVPTPLDRVQQQRPSRGPQTVETPKLSKSQPLTPIAMTRLCANSMKLNFLKSRDSPKIQIILRRVGEDPKR